MRGIVWIVLDDIKMNLVAALIVLVLAASFTRVVELPFRLTGVERSLSGSGAGKVRSTKILVYKKAGELVLRMGEKEARFGEAGGFLKEINPALPVVLAVERESGLRYDQLVKILAVLKANGVSNVSLLAEGN